MYVHTQHISCAPEPTVNSKVGEEGISTCSCYAGYAKQLQPPSSQKL